MKLLDQKAIPELIETITESTFKAIEDLELLEEGGILDVVPFGKIAKYLTKKIITIEDPSKALKKAIGIAGFKTFVEGLQQYEINPLIEEAFLKDEIPSIKKRLKAKLLKATQFDVEGFSNNEIIQFYKKELIQILKKLSVPERQINLAHNYLDAYYKLNFLKIIEEGEVVYEKLNNLIDSRSYKESLNAYKYEMYRQKLKGQFTDIVLNDTSDLRLCDIYIEPGYSIHKNCFTDNDSRLNPDGINRDKGFICINKGVSVHDFIDQFIHSRVDSTLKSKKAQILFLMGYPGQGKSSLCKKLLNDCIDGSRTIEMPVYFIKFRNIANSIELINSPLTSIEKYVRDNEQFEFDKGDFNRSVLVLDGLDELFMREDMPSNAIDEFCRLLIHQIDSRPNLKVLITSRYGYVKLEQLRSENSLLVQLNEFELHQQKTWLNVYRVFHGETPLTVSKLEEIHNSPASHYLKELISQPILLHMVATLKENIDLSANRARIYDNLYTQLINRSWDKTGPIDNLQGISPNDLREFLRNIAFAIFVSGKEYINKSELVEMPATREFMKKLEHPAFKDALKRIMIAFYFQETKKESQDDFNRDKNEYAIEFLHKSLQEYLVAEKIWQSILDFIDKKGGGKYVIDDEQQALIETSKLFSQRIITEEIRGYLREIIENDIGVNKSELCMRMERFLPYCLDKQFHIDGTEHSKNISYECFTNFYGYWFVISSLNQKKNIIPANYKEKFGFFLRFLEGDKTPINLSYQDLNTTKLVCINLAGSDLSFGIFTNAAFDQSNFFHANLIGANFKGALLNMVNFHESNLEKTNFTKTRLFMSNFNGCVLKDCSFLNSNLEHSNLTFTTFFDVVFDGCDLSYANMTGSIQLEAKILLKAKNIKEIVGVSKAFLDNLLELRTEIGLT